MNNQQWVKKIKAILKNRKSLIIGIIVGLAYILVCLISIEHIFWSGQKASMFFVETPMQKMLIARAPFIWEPVGSISLFGVTIFISPLNIITGMILGLLVGVNIMVSVFSYKYRKVFRLNTGYSLAGILPSMLSGFACCAPTFIIALAPALSSFTVFFLSIQPFLIPFSVIAMISGLIWSVSRLNI